MGLKPLLLEDIQNELSQEELHTLIQGAITGRERAYVPYSHFAVGAGLLTQSGELFVGCNIESCSYTPTNCAERTAFFSAIASGHRKFKAIAIVGAPEGESLGLYELCAPCGVCRQVMREFGDPERFIVCLARGLEDYQLYYLKDILPLGFGPESLEAKLKDETHAQDCTCHQHGNR